MEGLVVCFSLSFPVSLSHAGALFLPNFHNIKMNEAILSFPDGVFMSCTTIVVTTCISVMHGKY